MHSSAVDPINCAHLRGSAGWQVLGIKYPIMCAGMGHVTGAELSAAVSNAGGIGTIGAIGMSLRTVGSAGRGRLCRRPVGRTISFEYVVVGARMEP